MADTTVAADPSLGTKPKIRVMGSCSELISGSASAFDVLVHTDGGLIESEIENIRSTDIVVIIGGRSGTLGEFAIAY